VLLKQCTANTSVSGLVRVRLDVLLIETLLVTHSGEPMPTYVKAPKEERYGLVGRKGRRVAA
jgi:hypothetical protein